MAAKKKAKKVSGPSGKHTKPGILLRAAQAEFDVWCVLAERAGKSLSQWIRDVCNRAAKQ